MLVLGVEEELEVNVDVEDIVIKVDVGLLDIKGPSGPSESPFGKSDDGSYLWAFVLIKKRRKRRKGFIRWNWKKVDR